MSSPVEQIKERLSIVDVISSYLKLEKAGLNFRARCPFHNERTPSFFVSPARGTFHCFGCSKGGDIFTFVEEMEGADFSEALKILALRAGVDLKKAEKGDSEISELYRILEEATKFFEKNLGENKEAVDYLRNRGLKDETIKNFRIGYAPDSWFALLNHLKKEKMSDRLAEKAGLVILGERGYHDRFRGRVMFPIANSQGRIVGFSGRILKDDKEAAKADFAKAPPAKYINSPETVLYNKSKILFGYDKAKRAIMQKNAGIVVEGQMDLIISHQEGFDHTVAVSGTALTGDHLDLIKRFTDTLVLGFDADQAGLKASERSVEAALDKGMDVKLAGLPKGLDPADFILKDKAGWERSLTEAKHIIDFYLDFLAGEGLVVRDLSKAITQKILPYIASLQSKLDQAHFIKKVAGLLGVEERAVQEELEKVKVPGKENLPPERQEKKEILPGQFEEKILGIIIWQKELKDSKIDIAGVKGRLETITGQDREFYENKLKELNKPELIFQTEMYYSGDEHLDQTVEELLDNFEKEILESKLKDLLKVLQRQETLKKETEVEAILKGCQIISKKIHEIKNKKRK